MRGGGGGGGGGRDPFRACARIKKGEEEREGKGLANRVGLARQMECERGRISRDNETTFDRISQWLGEKMQCVRACVGCSKPLFPFLRTEKPLRGFMQWLCHCIISAISNDDVATAFLASPVLPMPCHSSEPSCCTPRTYRTLTIGVQTNKSITLSH